MPSNDPMWYCHECHAEMRPLFVPDPHCASCNGTFVEQIDMADDPRGEPRLEGIGMGEANDPILHMLQAMAMGRPPGPPGSPRPSPGTTTGDNHSPGERGTEGGTNPNVGNVGSGGLFGRPDGGGGGGGGPVYRGGGPGFTFEVRTSGTGGTTRRIILGGPNTLRRGGNNTDPSGARVTTLPEYLRNLSQDNNNNNPANPNPNNDNNPNADPNGQRDPFDNPFLVRQYLLTMLGFPPTMMNGGGGPMEGGRMGDYVFSQDALEQIMNQLMENGHKPVPLPDKDIDDLPRGVLVDDSDILGKDCQVCQDTFEVPKPDEEVSEGMLTTVTLPCKHSFHEDCIVPWLKQSGTCPVCRHALVPQPPPRENPQSPPTGGGGGSGNSSFNFSTSGNSGVGGGGASGGGGNSLFGSLFGFGGSGNPSGSGGNGGYGRSRGNGPSDTSRIPGSWQDID